MVNTGTLVFVIEPSGRFFQGLIPVSAHHDEACFLKCLYDILGDEPEFVPILRMGHSAYTGRHSIYVGENGSARHAPVNRLAHFILERYLGCDVAHTFVDGMVHGTVIVAGEDEKSLTPSAAEALQKACENPIAMLLSDD